MQPRIIVFPCFLIFLLFAILIYSELLQVLLLAELKIDHGNNVGPTEWKSYLLVLVVFVCCIPRHLPQKCDVKP